MFLCHFIALYIFLVCTRRRRSEIIRIENRDRFCFSTFSKVCSALRERKEESGDAYLDIVHKCFGLFVFRLEIAVYGEFHAIADCHFEFALIFDTFFDETVHEDVVGS